jgi:hypothetical protein
MIRMQTEDIQHFTCNKRQTFDADKILQKKDYILLCLSSTYLIQTALLFYRVV